MIKNSKEKTIEEMSRRELREELKRVALDLDYYDYLVISYIPSLVEALTEKAKRLTREEKDLLDELENYMF